MNEELYKYSGLVSQEEFNIRYGLSQLRIALGYTQEEVSFLMGKHPYFYGEYEEMNDGCNISDQDRLLICSIYKSPFISPLSFERDEYGFKQKRLIKGVRNFKNGIYYHTLTHPWLIITDKEKRLRENLPIHFKELPFCIEQDCQEDALNEFRIIVSDLLDGYFMKSPRLPIHIYEHIRLYHFNPILRPIFLKQAVYEFMAKKVIQMKTIENKIHYSVQH